MCPLLNAWIYPRPYALLGGAATGSMTRYDERHENLIRPDFQYIIRVTKKSSHHGVKTEMNEAVRSAGLPFATYATTFQVVCAPVESRPKPSTWK